MAEKTIAFPNSYDGFLNLARLKSGSEEYDSAMQFAYKAYKSGSREEAAEFMARQLLLSENAHEALRILYRFFPDSENRPISVLYLMRDCFLAIHEYMNAHNTELSILDRGEQPEESEMPDSVEEMLAVYELSLNDAYAFGCDDSALTDAWCDIRPIMNICAVHNAFYYMANGDFERVINNMHQPLLRCFYTDEISLPEEYLLENCGLFMNACILGGRAEQYIWCLNGMNEIPSQMPRSLSAVTAFALIAKLTQKSNFSFEDFPENPELSREELLSISMSLICADENALAYKYIKNARKYAPYNIGINRIFAYCAYACGDLQGCYEAYDRMHKLMMWDKATEYTRSRLLDEIKGNSSEKTISVPLSAEDRSEAAESAMDDIALMLNQSLKDLEKMLDEDGTDILCTYFSAMKPDIQEDVARHLCTSDAESIQALLRRLLLDRYTEAEVKNIILRKFRKKKDIGKIACCCNGNFIEAYPYMHADLPIPEEYNDEYKTCYNNAVRTYGEACALAVNYYYEYFSEFCLNTDEAKPNLAKAFAAIVLSMALHKCGKLTDTENLAKTYYIDTEFDEITEMLEIMDESERGFIYDLYGDM